MKSFISLILLLFLSFQVQAQVLIEYDQEIDLTYWENFLNEGHIEEMIDDRNWEYSIYGFFATETLKIAKSDLIRLEQELGLYKQGKKFGLSEDQIEKAEEVINRHWGNIREIEEQFIYQAGLQIPTEDFQVMRILEEDIGDVEGFNKGMWELYNKDHQILFDLVEKTDENLYKNILGGDDEAYARLILPQVKKYTEKTNIMSEAYYNSLLSFYERQIPLYTMKDIRIADLLSITDNSLIIYECFLKNFENPEGGEYQKELKETIETWYGQQSEWGANSLMEAYNYYGLASNPSAVAYSLNDFRYAPQETLDKVIEFYRKEFIHNEDYINTNDYSKLGARANALIGLKYFDVLNEEEEELFKKALEQGVIRSAREDSYFGFSRPIIPDF